ncbi:MAG: DPP IV N-terminal domain-containing protein, partial [Flavobacterium sp.]
MEALQSLKNTNEYTVLNYDRATRTYQIDLYDFATLTKKKTLLDTKNHKELTSIESYTFNALENQMLIALNGDKIYRHSSVSDTYLYDIAAQSLIKVADYKIQEPTFSPKGDKIAYAYQNNLYVYDIRNNQHQQITTDGKKNQIINGITDWVYEEEFAFVKAFQWNASGTHLAYIRFDETEVPEFSMDVYGTALYPTQEVFKYPKAGEKNAEVSLHLYELNSNTTNKVDMSSYNDFYIARLHTTSDADFFSIQVLNRHQNQLDLRFVDIKNGQSKIVITEKDAAYVDVTDHLTFLKDNSFIWSSEKDGFNHLYHYDKSGKLINQITKGNWEVTAYYGLDEKSKTIFYQSTERGSTVRDVYKIGLNGKNKSLLTPQTGTNKATFSPNFEFFINTYSSSLKPTKYTLHSSKNGSEIKTISDNNVLNDKLKE